MTTKRTRMERDVLEIRLKVRAEQKMEEWKAATSTKMHTKISHVHNAMGFRPPPRPAVGWRGLIAIAFHGHFNPIGEQVGVQVWPASQQPNAVLACEKLRAEGWRILHTVNLGGPEDFHPNA